MLPAFLSPNSGRAENSVVECGGRHIRLTHCLHSVRHCLASQPDSRIVHDRDKGWLSVFLQSSDYDPDAFRRSGMNWGFSAFQHALELVL